MYVVHRSEEAEGAEVAAGGEYGVIEVRDIGVKYMAPDYTEVAKDLKEGEYVVVEVREEFKNESTVEIKEVQESPF